MHARSRLSNSGRRNRQKSQAYCGHHKKSCNKYMCEATIPTDSTECFHCFLAEVGVEVLRSYTFRKKRKILVC
jgi:hypothetical protein